MNLHSIPTFSRFIQAALIGFQWQPAVYLVSGPDLYLKMIHSKKATDLD